MSKLSLIYIDQKPTAPNGGCVGCPYASTGLGFVPDFIPPNPKLAFLAEAPGGNEQDQRLPMAGGSGWILNMAVQKAGYARHDCLIANVLRCRPNSFGVLNKYPTGPERQQAEHFCRKWDDFGNIDLAPGGLNGFKPDHYLITIHPAVVLRTWTLKRIFEADIAKAFRLYESGKRVLVLLGDKATEKVFPNQIEVGVTKIRGTWGPLNWEERRK